jgi:hypothetical protein
MRIIERTADAFTRQKDYIKYRICPELGLELGARG